MKAFITPSYVFTPGASGAGTIDLTDIPAFDVKKLAAIINQTDGIIIYSTANLNKRFTSESAGIVTLFFDTSAMSSGDTLQIVYETDTSIQFVKDSVTVNVTEDTVTPANNVALPAMNFIIQDGVPLPVNKNTTNSGLTVAIPVEDFGVNNTLTFMSDIVQEINLTPSSNFGVPALAYSPLVNKYKTLSVDVNNALKVSAADLPLPLGAATELAQSDLLYKTPSAIVTVSHDEIVTTYVGATTDINTVVYKEAGNVVSTLTFSYDGSNRLIGVVRS
jgi:hypothetical protein